MTTPQPNFRATDGADRLLEPATPQLLRAFLEDCTDFVILDCPDRPDEYAQAARWDDGSWMVEIRTPGGQAQLRTDAPNTDATYDIFRSWAAADDWWRHAFDWQPVAV